MDRQRIFRLPNWFKEGFAVMVSESPGCAKQSWRRSTDRCIPCASRSRSRAAHARILPLPPFTLPRRNARYEPDFINLVMRLESITFAEAIGLPRG